MTTVSIGTVDSLRVTAEFDVDSSAPVFYLSYARPRPVLGDTRRDRPEHVRNLFFDLSEQVAELVAPQAGQEPGFMDASLEGGGRWDDAILSAVGRCQVFVALLSPAYFRSQWCAMEWNAFARRRVQPHYAGAAGHDTNIVPVLWTPRVGDVPEPVSRVSAFVPTGLPGDYAARYRENGLLGLLHTHQADVYHAVVWKLALRIRQQASASHVEPEVLRSTEGLARSFGGDR